MDGGAWCATVHGVAKSQTRLSDFTHRGQVSLSLPYSQFKIITLKFPSFYILGNTYSNFWSSIVETFNKGAPAPGKLDMWRQWWGGRIKEKSCWRCLCPLLGHSSCGCPSIGTWWEVLGHSGSCSCCTRSTQILFCLSYSLPMHWREGRGEWE